MRIAFDVKGTLDGPCGPIIIDALRKLQTLGHDCVVWSSLYSYAIDAVLKYNLNCDAELKQGLSHFKTYDIPLYDVAIEDDRIQDAYLGAKRFVFVDQIGNDLDDLVNLILKG